MGENVEKPPVVILCGGKGTRLNEETEFRPKPLVPIGDKPILWHIMKHYSKFGFKKFILCLGYKGDMIQSYFQNYFSKVYDFSLNLKTGEETYFKDNDYNEDWEIIFANSGLDTQTGGRIKYASKYLKNYDTFFLTYGDGLSNIELDKLLEFHKKSGKICTITGVKPYSKYGIIKVNENNEASHFVEKPPMEDFISGGFMVMDKKFLDYLQSDDTFEVSVLPKLAAEKQIAIFKHEGFWHAMDNYKDYLDLNKLWNDGKEKQEFTIGENNYVLVTIPPNVWSGFKALNNKKAIVADFTDLPYSPDDAEKKNADELLDCWKDACEKY